MMSQAYSYYTPEQIAEQVRDGLINPMYIPHILDGWTFEQAQKLYGLLAAESRRSELGSRGVIIDCNPASMTYGKNIDPFA